MSEIQDEKQWEEDFPPPDCCTILILRNEIPNLIFHYRSSHWCLLEAAWVIDNAVLPATAHFTSPLPDVRAEMGAGSGQWPSNRLWEPLKTEVFYKAQKFIILGSSFTPGITRAPQHCQLPQC